MSASLCLEWVDIRFPRLVRFLTMIIMVGAYASPSAQLVAKTQEVWSRKLGREVSEQEARTIIHDFRNFLALLKEIWHGK